MDANHHTLARLFFIGLISQELVKSAVLSVLQATMKTQGIINVLHVTLSVRNVQEQLILTVVLVLQMLIG